MDHQIILLFVLAFGVLMGYGLGQESGVKKGKEEEAKNQKDQLEEYKRRYVYKKRPEFHFFPQFFFNQDNLFYPSSRDDDFCSCCKRPSQVFGRVKQWYSLDEGLWETPSRNYKVCLNCIADGSAAKKNNILFNVFFEYPGNKINVSKELRDQIESRTPPCNVPLGEEESTWLVHLDNPYIYKGFIDEGSLEIQLKGGVENPFIQGLLRHHNISYQELLDSEFSEIASIHAFKHPVTDDFIFVKPGI